MFPYIPCTGYDKKFRDEGNDQSLLGQGTFNWLVNIRLSHSLYRCENVIFLESYVPYIFVRHFGYDQLYVGNPNPRLGRTSSLIDGTHAWRYIIAGCTGARFCMPQQTPNLLTSLGFCQWYYLSNSYVPEFKINISGVKLIANHLRLRTQKARSPRELLRRLYRGSSARSTRAPLKKMRKKKILISTSKGSESRFLLASFQERSKQ